MRIRYFQAGLLAALLFTSCVGGIRLDWADVNGMWMEESGYRVFMSGLGRNVSIESRAFETPPAARLSGGNILTLDFGGDRIQKGTVTGDIIAWEDGQFWLRPSPETIPGKEFIKPDRVILFTTSMVKAYRNIKDSLATLAVGATPTEKVGFKYSVSEGKELVIMVYDQEGSSYATVRFLPVGSGTGPKIVQAFDTLVARLKLSDKDLQVSLE